MKTFTVATGNGSTYNYEAEHMEIHDQFVHFMVGDKIVGMKSTYGIVSISDKPFDQRHV